MGIGYYEGQLGVNRTLVQQNDNYFYGGPDTDDVGESMPGNARINADKF